MYSHERRLAWIGYVTRVSVVRCGSPESSAVLIGQAVCIWYVAVFTVVCCDSPQSRAVRNENVAVLQQCVLVLWNRGQCGMGRRL